MNFCVYNMETGILKLSLNNKDIIKTFAVPKEKFIKLYIINKKT